MASLLNLPLEIRQPILISVLFGQLVVEESKECRTSPFLSNHGAILSVNRQIHNEAWDVISSYACLRLKIIHYKEDVDSYKRSGSLLYTEDIVLPRKTAREATEHKTYTETLMSWPRLGSIRHFLVVVDPSWYLGSDKRAANFHMYWAMQDYFALLDAPTVETVTFDFPLPLNERNDSFRRALVRIPAQFNTTVHFFSFDEGLRLWDEPAANLQELKRLLKGPEDIRKISMSR